jgi:hypothetical protein
MSKAKKFTKTPDELRELLGMAASEYAVAREKLKRLEVQKAFLTAKTAVILSAKRFDLLTNEALRAHYQTCCEDPKFRLTNDLIHSFSYLENRIVFEAYEAAEKIAKGAQEEHDMWNKQLMWYQSENKLKGAELLSLKE